MIHPTSRSTMTVKRLLAGAFVGVLGVACGSGYTAPDGPGDPFFYAAIQEQYDQGDCDGLDAIIQGWREPPPDPFADSYIAEAEQAKTALDCPS
jgi:hypothetical protein